MTKTTNRIKDFWCPSCDEKGLHFYTKNGKGIWGNKPIRDINYLWCLNCGIKIECKIKKRAEMRGKK